ncbi:MAG TPA: efflux RND transporter periplasmic adaptor subunit [Thermoanaerobaculia bacterium]|nr:efflux RND transporter periplasmic adaptor subunit [Thermoanaerobaculia bacterium]
MSRPDTPGPPGGPAGPPPRHEPVARSRGKVLLAIGVLAAAGLAAAGIVPRMRAEAALARQTRESAVPAVTVIVPRQGAAAQEIVLPGAIQAWEDAPIFARTSGYLRRWFADIGARVKQGQLLAEIETPEVDRQLDQARADLATASANSELAEVIAARYVELRKTDSVSQQDLDNALGDAKAKRAMVNSAQANVKRLEQLQSFEKIYAPFDGVVTARNTDVGQLIDPGTGSGAARELFHVAATRTLRVYVNVPQVYSGAALPGVHAYLTLAEAPGRRFPGKLVRNANAIDVASRTLRAEVDVDNGAGELLPGAYAQVHLELAAAARTLVVPVSALIFQSEGLRLATVDAADRVHLTQVSPGRDFGNEVEVVAGLGAGQRVIDSPPDSLVEGQRVRVVAAHHETGGHGS